MNAPLADLHGEILAPAGDSDLWIVGGGNVASQFADGGYSMRWP
jgi:dihydrofolate reductase